MESLKFKVDDIHCAVFLKKNQWWAGLASLNPFWRAQNPSKNQKCLFLAGDNNRCQGGKFGA